MRPASHLPTPLNRGHWAHRRAPIRRLRLETEVTLSATALCRVATVRPFTRHRHIARTGLPITSRLCRISSMCDDVREKPKSFVSQSGLGHLSLSEVYLFCLRFLERWVNILGGSVFLIPFARLGRG